MLIIIENILSKAEVAEFRARLATADWQDGTGTAGTLARLVKQNLQLNDHDALAVELGQQLLRKLAHHPQFISASLAKKIYPPKFNCYQDGGQYGVHVDSAVMQLPGVAQSLRSDLSATLFLSEPEDYQGGELEIETGFGTQAVKLSAGDMVLYPSSSLHRVTPVTAGARLASFFWIESMVADAADRANLYDLDTAIQQLSAGLDGENPALLQLSGVYHNLLRRWALT